MEKDEIEIPLLFCRLPVPLQTEADELSVSLDVCSGEPLGLSDGEVDVLCWQLLDPSSLFFFAKDDNETCGGEYDPADREPEPRGPCMGW